MPDFGMASDLLDFVRGAMGVGLAFQLSMGSAARRVAWWCNDTMMCEMRLVLWRQWLSPTLASPTNLKSFTVGA